MKKLLSLALLVVMVLSMAIIPSAAADIDVTGRKNVCLDAGIFTYYEQFNMSKTDRIEQMFDGVIDRVDDTGAQNFADFSMLATAWTEFYNSGALDGTRYNELGDADPSGKYLTGIDFILDDVYTVDTIRVFLDEMEAINDLCIDGFEVLVRETEDDKWTTIYSVSNLATEAKYKVHEGANGQQTAYVEATFAPVKAGYIRFSLTAPRSALSVYADGGTAHRFWRITELELYEAKAGEDTTTVAPDTTTVAPDTTTAAPDTTTAAPDTTTAAPDTTTAAPDTTTAAPDTTTAAPDTTTAAPDTTTAAPDTTTAAPDTTTAAPTQTPDTADVLPLVCIGLMLAAAACLTLRKKFN